jgi:hypothetical protein
VTSHCGAGISVAYRCVDGPELPTNYQKTYPDYDAQETEAKAQQSLASDWAQDAKRLKRLTQKDVKVVRIKVKIKSPIALGKRLRVAQPRSDDSTDTTEPEEVQVDSGYPAEYIQFPQSLFPFVRAAGGGIYYQPPPKTQKDGTQYKTHHRCYCHTTLYH